MTTLRPKLRDVFTNARDFYQFLEFVTEDPQYTPLAREFEAGLEVLDSLLGKEGQLVDNEARAALSQSLARFRYDVKASFPLQARFVTSVLDKIAEPSCSGLQITSASRALSSGGASRQTR